MAIEIKEYVNAKFSFVEGSTKSSPMSLAEARSYSNKIAKGSIMGEIEGLHSVITRNDTLYTDNAMKKSEKYWTNPYEIPVILHHDEEKGITVGRVKHAYWTDKGTRSNTGALRFLTNIAHKEGIEGIKNGTLSTVSVGVLADEVRCSICNQDIAAYGECDHERGGYYDGEKCYWRIESFEPKELSFVIVPSDPYAHIIDVYEPEKKDLKENKGVDKMDTWLDLIRESQEKIDLAESSKKEEKTKTLEDEKEETKEKEEDKKSDDNDMHADGNEDNKGEKESEEDKNNDEGDNDNKEDESKGEEDKDGEANSKTEEVEDKKEESTEENKETTKEEEKEVEPVKKELDEEVKKDIEVEKTDIYKNMKVALDAVTSENAMLKKELEAIKAQLKTEVTLKESAENTIIQMKTEKKKVLVSKVNKLRESMNLEKEDEETLMKSNEESLNMAIKTLREFNSKVGITAIPKIKSEVAITESKDNTQKNIQKQVKDTKQASNINFEESLIEDIFSAAFNGQKF